MGCTLFGWFGGGGGGKGGVGTVDRTKLLGALNTCPTHRMTAKAVIRLLIFSNNNARFVVDVYVCLAKKNQTKFGNTEM